MKIKFDLRAKFLHICIYSNFLLVFALSPKNFEVIILQQVYIYEI